MPDLSQLSDEELEKLAGGAPGGGMLPAPKSKMDFSSMSDEELAQIAGDSEEEGGVLKDLGRSALDKVAKVGRFIDRYTGAPTRTAIGELQGGKGLLEAGQSAMSQFGQEPELAPTGKQLAQRAGVPETTLSQKIPSLYSDTGDEFLKFKRGGLLDPTASGAAGLGLDIAADPTNIIPFGALAKGAAKGAKLGAKGVAEGAGLLGKGAALGTDLVTGTRAGTRTLDTIKGIGKAGKEISGDVLGHVQGLVKTSANPKFAKFSEIAAKNGIDPNLLPSSVKYEGLLPRIEQAQALGVGGQEILEKNAKAFSQFDSAIDNVIDKIGGSVDPVVAGEVVQSGYKKAVDNLFQDAALRYSNLHKLSPNLQLTEDAATSLMQKINGLEKKMAGYGARGIAEQKQMANDVLNVLDSVKKSGGGVKQLSEQIHEIGKLAYSPKSSWKLPIDQDAFRDLYAGLKDSLEKTADDLSPDIGKQLRDSNEQISSFLKNLEPIQKTLESKTIAPESLFKSLTADSKRLESLFKMLGPEEARSLKGAIISSLVKTSANDAVQINRTIQALKQATPKLSKVFSKAELSELEELLELGAAMGNRMTPATGLPQTGVLSGFRELPKRMSEAIVDKQVLNALKRGERGAGELEGLLGGGKSAADAAADASQGLLMPVPSAKGLLNLRRSRMGLIGKGAQSIAPSTYEEQ